MKLRAMGSAMVLFMELVSRAGADYRYETLRFRNGVTKAAMNGEISGYDSVKYLFSAEAGQALSAQLIPGSHGCHMRVWMPGADHATFVGAASGNEYSARLVESGVYIVQVHLARVAARRGDACRYHMTIELTGEAYPAPKPRPSLH